MDDFQDLSSHVGFTSTIPVEIVLAAGFKPIDLNNLFINTRNSEKLVRQAETAGFSHSICSWIKGIYSTVINLGFNKMIAVTGGDCSNTVALSELLTRRGVKVTTFDYPPKRDPDSLRHRLQTLADSLSVDEKSIEQVREKLVPIRIKLKELDRLTYEENRITSLENHLFLVSSTDFNSDPETFEYEIDNLLKKARSRTAMENKIRLGYLGVPPIFSGFYEAIESFGARVVFNEVQRQFSMPYFEKDMIYQYLRYTYPYDAAGRIEDIQEAIKERGLDGLIHYTQTFCYRQIYDILLREQINIPILTLEGDRPGDLDGRTAFRLETFIEMLRSGKEG